MRTKNSASILVVTLAAAWLAGCVERRVVYVREPVLVPPPATDQTVITTSPPAPQVEIVGAPPGPEYVWVPGCWEWRGRWVWTGGRWAMGPHPHAAWIPGRWVRRGHDWVWIRGYWR